MRKFFVLILFIFVISSISFAQTAKVSNQIPEKVVFPYISVNTQANQENCYNITFEELKVNKIGNSISPLVFNQYKAEIFEQTKNNQEENLTVTCAKKSKGYYLKITIVMSGVMDNAKGTFELFDPNTLNNITKFEVKSSGALKALLAFGSTDDKIAAGVIKKGIKQLAEELQTAKPDLIIK